MPSGSFMLMGIQVGIIFVSHFWIIGLLTRVRPHVVSVFRASRQFFWWTSKVTSIQEGSPISVVIALAKLSAIATLFILPSPLASGMDSWYH